MNESENLLIIALNQLGVLSQECKSLMQITNDDFARILLKLCKKITSLKGIEVSLPEVLSKDMNTKYRECQKIVEFMKQIGFKLDLNLNNILFPSIRDMQRLFEYTLEYITNIDTGVLDYAQNINETNFFKIKTVKMLSTWTKEIWITPELKLSLGADNNRKLLLRKLEKNKLNSIKKKIPMLEVPESLKVISENKSEELNSLIGIITEDVYKVPGYSFMLANNNYIVDKLKSKNKLSSIEKSTNQQFVELLNKRGSATDFIRQNYHENNFMNNVKIIEKRNKEIYGNNFFKRDEISSSFNNSETKNSENENFSVSSTDYPENSLIQHSNNQNNPNNATNIVSNNINPHQKKIDTIISNFENEIYLKNSEISELNNKLQNTLNMIESSNQTFIETQSKAEDLNKIIDELSLQNKKAISSIEEKMETFEQIQKLNRSEIKESDIDSELVTLEKKYDEMVNNWEEYSSQAKSRIEELKVSVETKKKEYNFKYEKITSIKKEIEDISNKIAMKQELAGFLNDEYQKIPIDINRNKFISKISDLTHNISIEKNNIVKFSAELKISEDRIVSLNDTIKRVDNELEEKLFQDAKGTIALKELYALFIKIREGYNAIQKNIIDSQINKNRIKELENKIEDYEQKLKSYDLKQLKEQVDLLKYENIRK